MLQSSKILSLSLFVLVLLSACQPTTRPEKAPAGPAFLTTPYWLSSSFLDAVAADSDSIGSSNCMELHFRFKDSVLVVNCESDAMLCAYSIIDDKTIEITSGFGEEIKPRITQVSETELELSGIYEDEKILFRTFDNPDPDPRGLSIKHLAQTLAGTYQPSNPAAKPVTLSADGKVKGLDEYIQFETAIGGDLAATETGNMLYFISDKGEMPLAWSKKGDTLKFWKLKNVSAPDEKPWYEVDGVYDVWVRKR